MVIVGLPRSGTSILFELLSQDPDVGVPLMWEALQPCPPPEAATYTTDARIAQADKLFTQWNRVAPEFASMHEMRGDIPAECGLLMAGTFISDHIAALHQTHSYSAWCIEADFLPVYRYHKTILQILQWKNPRPRWLLKAPEHQVHLDTLLQVYPDARIVQTHRDPIKCMASTTSLMGTLYSMRSDQPFNAQLFDNIIMGEATAQRLEHVIKQRETGHRTGGQYCRLALPGPDGRSHVMHSKDLPALRHGAVRRKLRPGCRRILRPSPRASLASTAMRWMQRAAGTGPCSAHYQQLYDVPSES